MALLAVLAACGQAAPAERAGTAGEAREQFEPRRWQREVLLRRFDFAAAATLAEWQLGDWEGRWQPLRSIRGSAGGLRLAEPEARYWLRHDLSHSERAVRLLRIAAEGFVAGDLFTVCWQRRGEDWDCSPATAEEGQVARTVEIPPRQGPPLDSVKLQLTTTQGRELVLRELELLALAPGPIEPPAGPWRVSLGGETRDAFVARSGELTVSVPRPANGSLRLAVGASAEAASVTSFAVKASRAAGAPVLARGRSDGPSSGGDLESWQELVVPATGPGTPGELVLAVQTTGAQPGDGFVYWSVEAEPAPGARGPDILLISLDTVRADRMSLYGAARPTTPRLDAWAAERAVVFEQVMAPAPWTLPSHASVFSGVYPFRHGANMMGAADARFPVLAELARRAGYRTLATTVGPVLTPLHGFDRGFSRFRVRANLGAESHRYELDQGVADVLDWLRDGRERADFVFFHTYQAHDPHAGEPPAFAAFGGELQDPSAYVTLGRVDRDPAGLLELEWALVDPSAASTRPLVPGADDALISALYDSGLVRLDEAIGGLLERLAVEGLADDLVVVLFSDHGESLLERGLAGHHHLYEENLRVPLLVATPAGRPSRVQTPVSLVDVFPTLLELARAPVPADVDGVSLVAALGGGEPPPRRLWAYAANSNRGFAVRTEADEKLFFLSSAWWPGERAQGLRLDADPGERRPTAVPEARRTQLRRQVARHLRAAPSSVLVHLANAGAEGFELVLQGPDAHPGGVESLTAPAGCCRFGSRELRLRVEPGERYELLLVDRPHADLRVTVGGIEGAAAFPAGSGADFELHFDGTEWHRGAGPSAPARVRLSRRGGGRGTPDDAETARENLRALGYVD